jgi:hypothetical protein
MALEEQVKQQPGMRVGARQSVRVGNTTICVSQTMLGSTVRTRKKYKIYVPMPPMPEQPDK